MSKYAVSTLIIFTLSGCSLSDPYPSWWYHNDGDVMAVSQPVADVTKAVNIVVLGDGYIREDLLKSGAYETEAKLLIRSVLGSVPYNQYSNYINAFIVFAQSAERGADLDPDEDTQNTVFDATYNYLNIFRLLVVQRSTLLTNYAHKIGIRPDIIIVSVNDTNYGGSGGTFAVTSRGGWSQYVILHETGHSFGGLADEYVDESIISSYPIGLVANYPNVDLTNNLSVIKWKHFVGLPGYSAVGAYEGAFYRTFGVWRPQSTCTMRDYGELSFCHPCREAIVKKIMARTGQAYSFTDFTNRNPAAVPAWHVQGVFSHTAMPMIPHLAHLEADLLNR